MKIYHAPEITVVAVPQFTEPSHLPVRWLGEHTDLEAVAEYAGRVCYMSQANVGQKTTTQYLHHILEQKHGSVLEHGQITYLVEGVSRALTHELIRHRVGTSVSQLSQRFVDESAPAFVCPPAIQPHTNAYTVWLEQCLTAQAAYISLCEELQQQVDPSLPATARRKQVREAARAVLPNCVETKLVWSCNLRELRHILLLRGSTHADAEIRLFAQQLLTLTAPLAPGVLGDLVDDPEQGIISVL